MAQQCERGKQHHEPDHGLDAIHGTPVVVTVTCPQTVGQPAGEHDPDPDARPDEPCGQSPPLRAQRPRRHSGRRDPDRRAAQAHHRERDGEHRRCAPSTRKQQSGGREAQTDAHQRDERQASRERRNHDRAGEVRRDVDGAEQAGDAVRAEEVVADGRQDDAVREPAERLRYAHAGHHEHDDDHGRTPAFQEGQAPIARDLNADRINPARYRWTIGTLTRPRLQQPPLA